jgi:hypothetical protein
MGACPIWLRGSCAGLSGKSMFALRFSCAPRACGKEFHPDDSVIWETLARPGEHEVRASLSRIISSLLIAREPCRQFCGTDCAPQHGCPSIFGCPLDKLCTSQQGARDVDLALRLDVMAVCVVFAFVAAILLGAF